MREKLLNAAALKRDIPAVFLALRAKETPLAAKLLAALTVCCALSPMDLIPDFVPVLGWGLAALLILRCIFWRNTGRTPSRPACLHQNS